MREDFSKLPELSSKVPERTNERSILFNFLPATDLTRVTSAQSDRVDLIFREINPWFTFETVPVCPGPPGLYFSAPFYRIDVRGDPYNERKRERKRDGSGRDRTISGILRIGGNRETVKFSFELPATPECRRWPLAGNSLLLPSPNNSGRRGGMLPQIRL